MNFKIAIVVIAAAFCAAEASRSVRSIDSIIKNAGNTLKKGLAKVEEVGENALKKGMAAVQDIEGVVLTTGTGILKSAGIDVDLNQIAKLAESNIKDCATSGEIKSQAQSVKNDLISCVAGDVNKVNAAVNDIKNVINGAKKVPQLLDSAIATCKKGSFFTRLTKCAKAVANVATEGNLTGVPNVITKHISTITGIINTVKAGSTNCIKNKIVGAGPSLATLSKNLGECAKNGATEAALPALAGFTEAAASLGNIGSLLG